MGAWNTLHLFDSDQFYEKGVSVLKGESKTLLKDYSDFIRSFGIGGVADLSADQLNQLIEQSVESIIETSNLFDDSLKKHQIYDALDSDDQKRVYLNEHAHYYDFDRFFEYYLFKHYADFYPHLNCGKHGLLGKLNPKRSTVANEALYNLEDANNYFCADMMGIVNWIAKEDAELLLNCREDFTPGESYDSLFNSFFTLVEIAVENGLGLLRGVDMRESILEMLPQNKLTHPAKWETYDFHGIFDINKAE
ncbi:MAG: hypothetical protein AAFQ94_06745 [Bacteroidota bacterium]